MVVDQAMETKVLEDMTVTMKELTMVAMGTIMTLVITVDNRKGAVWVEEAQAVPVVVAMDPVLEAVHMVADGFQKAAEKGCGS